MLKRFHLTVGALAVSSFVALGVLTGCGSSDSPEQGTEPEAAKTTDAATGTTAPERGVNSPGDKKSGNGKSGGQQTPGSGPASAKDKQGKAPDDVISKRPGGPKSPGTPQPIK